MPETARGLFLQAGYHKRQVLKKGDSAMILNMSHVCINVSDIERTIEFYNRKLGFPVKFSFVKLGRLFGAYFQINPSTFIEAFQVSDLNVCNTGIVHICFETDNIDRCISDLRSKGIDCTDKQLGCSKSWATWFTDPDGNRLEINEYTPESAHICGGTVEVTW